jgi:hypothetical protein
MASCYAYRQGSLHKVEHFSLSVVDRGKEG